MGFFLQLPILLWKNFTLKKRSPIVVMMEMFLPLVLFVILLIIRNKLPAYGVTATRYNVQPLPSSGVVSVMQAFCDSSRTDEHGFPEFPRSTASKLLKNFQNVAEHNNFFDPGFSVEQMDHLPDLYRSIIDDPAALHNAFEQAKGWKVSAFLTNQSSLLQTLAQNFSIPTEDIDTVLNAHINFTEVYRLLMASGIFDIAAKIGRHRTRRDLTDIIGGSTSQISGILGQHLGDILKDQLQKSAAVGAAGQAASRLASQMLLDHPKYLMDPEVMKVAGVLLGFNSPSQLDPVIVADVLKKILLDPVNLHFIVCDDAEEMNRILIFPENNNTHFQDATQAALCNMSTEGWQKLSQVLNQDISSHQIVDLLQLENLNLTQATHRVKEFVTNLEEFILFEENLASLVKLASTLPQGNCGQSSSTVVTTAAPSNITMTTTTMGTNGTHHQPEDEDENDDEKKSDKKKKHHVMNKYAGLVKIWVAMQTTICGRPAISMDKLNSMSIDDPSLTSKHQKHDIGILVHLLYSNPKILYSPNGTQADEVIKKADGIFLLLDRISQYATKWLNVSSEIRDYLLQNDTKVNLDSIRNMQSQLHESPHLPAIAYLIHNDSIRRFIENGSVPSVKFFIDQLDVVDNAACSWLSLIKGIKLDIFKGFRTEEELVDYFLNQAYHDGVTVLASVVFTNMENDGKLPPHVVYKIRQNASFVQSTRLVREKFWYPGPHNWGYLYYQFGFVWIQDVIERAIVDLHANRSVTEPGSYVHQMPYPCYMQDSFLFMIEHVMPMCLTISWVYTVAMLVQSIVYEKEQRLKEVMKMMGLSNSVHWLAWFITTFVQMGITMAILTVMLKYGLILTHSNAFLIYFVLMLFVVATISFSFLISVCYSKAKLAAACAGIIYFITYVPYMYVAIREEAAGDKIEAWAKSLASLFSTTAFGLGAKYFAYYEVEGVGVQWGNIHISPVESDKYNLFSVMMMLIFDAILYGVLTWYIENIHPGSYGLPKPWYFPLTTSYWMGNGQTLTEQCSWTGCLGKMQPQSLSVREEDQACAMETISDEERHRFETEPSHLPVGVCIDNLTKVYKTGKLAVNKLHINLYESQITSLLGHNGAGKTTTMSILTGLFPPTAGTATICGLDIRSEMSEIRKGLGMCPQHNVLFDKLTVEEHLWFYARLKGISAFDIQQEMDTMIEDIGMPKKRSSTVDCLSGGMKRKLSVAIAFVAGSRTVILDEPTAGVDPYARRDIWDLIIKYKQGRTIMLSTHHMDEADILCDRIAIMSSGSIVCCGSSLFLKSLYGEGYHLKIVKRSMEEDVHSTDSTLLTDHSTPRSSFLTQCDESTVTAFIQGFMPAIYLKAETSQELHYILPFDEARKGGFEKLFKAFDENLDSLRISSYGVVDTSLEEVFLKVTELAEQKEQKEQQSVTADNQKNNAKETANMESHNAPLQGEPMPFDPLPTMDAALGDEVELGEMTANHTRSHHRTTSSVSVKSQESVRSMDSVRSLGELSLSEVLYSGVNPRSYTELANQDDDELIDLVLEGVGQPSVKGSLLYLQQFLAIIAKRFHYIRRNWKGLFSQILLPALFVCIAMTVALAAPRIKDLPPMVLSPAQYYNSTQPRGNFIPYSNIAAMPEYQNWSLDADTDDIVKTFFLPSGVSATCVLKTPFNSPFNVDILKKINQTHRNYKLLKRYFEPSCESVFVKGLTLDNFVPPERELIPTVTPVAVGNTTQFVTLKPSSPYVPRYYPICKCSKGNSSQACSHDGFKYPPITQLVTSDFLQDISGDKDEDYYLATTNMYRLHRYGGFSLGLKRDFVPVDFGKHAPPLFRKLAVRHASKIWYNHKGLHSLPVYINTLNNAILRANLPPEKGDPAGYGITVINHPMTSTNNHLSMEYILAGSDVLIAIFIIGAMSFVPASFVVFLVYERSIKAKHLQCVSGVNRVIYWLANYTWDMCNYIIPAACCVLILKIFDIPAYVSPTNFPAVIALFLLYGWSITPMMYPASFVFNEPSTAYICLIVINLFIGITCIITSFMLQMFAMNNNDADLKHTHEILKNIFLLFPNYCLGRGLMDIAFNEYQNQYYFKTGQYDQMKSPFEWDLTSRNLAAMAGLGFIFFIITILCEFRFFMKPRHVSVDSIVSAIDEDPDVANERRRVLHGAGRNDLLRLENLTKVYVTRKLGRHLATDRVCLGVPQGECFGLLGVNGAGKTTTFKMLTGDLSPTAGDAYLQGFSVLRDIGRVQERIGYCPQFDALYDELTAREHLQFYSRLRGIAVKDEAKVVNWALQKLCLEKYADIASGTYSGGNKRKLSTAIALIGQPPVIFLDEPTSGMDPHSRRFLWDLILKLIKGGKSVILTSHSMEECEVLCTRLAIMVNGHFKCLGSTQHLKDRFGDGYTISVRVRGPNYSREVVAVKRFIERHFPLAKLKECHHNMVQYELPSQDLSLAYVFSCLEEAQRDLQVEDYSVNQNTLDNVFINFAKQQQELVHATVSHDQNTPTQPSTPQRTRTRTSDITTPLSDVPESGDTDDDVVLLDDVNVDLEAITDDDDAVLLLNQTGTRLAFLNTDVSMC